MAEDKNKARVQELKDTEPEQQAANVIESKEEPEKKTTKKKKESAPKAIKSYVHIDTFLQTAIPFYKLSKMQAQGFKSRMNGEHYQRDEQVFVDKLKSYLDLK